MKEIIINNNVVDNCSACPYCDNIGMRMEYYYSPPTCNAPGIEEFEIEDNYNAETRHPKCPMVNRILKETYEWQ